jgi:hypothetical protein
MSVQTNEVREVLERTPGALRGLLSGLGEAWVTADEGPETFSPRDVLGHLTWGEETDWIPRALIILEQGEARPFDPFDRFGFRAAYGSLPLAALLDRFATLRGENLRRLDGFRLTHADLERKGTHPSLGTVTLGQLLATWAVHDLNHVGQIARVMARRYEGAVGPWHPYLGILGRTGM